MNKKVIASGVLTALMMGGFSGVQAADLEARVGVLETAVQGLGEKVGAMDPGAVAAEKTAREEEDTKIRGEFAEADKKLDEKITAEAQAREDGDKALDGKITAEETERKAEDAKIREEFAAADQAEKTAREAKEAELAGKINDEKDDREAKDTELANDINAEKTAREAADQDLQGKIDDINTTLNNGGIAASAEATEKANKAAEAAQKVADEMNARQDVQDQAINKNRKDIDKNIDDIANLKEYAVDETGFRKQADQKLGERIDGVQADLKKEKAFTTKRVLILNDKIKENKDQITQEIKDRKSADQELDEKITAEAKAREDGDKVLDGKITAEETERKAEDAKIREEFAAADKAEKDARVAEDKKIREDFAAADKAEKDARVAEDKKIRGEFAEADKKLDGKITAEAKAREDADKELEKKLTGRDNALAGRIDKLATDTDKGLAKVSALAGLHPLDYDPANKLNLAAAGGSYNGEHAFALGAFYRPNRNVMLSFGASLAGGDNAYNVGVSVKVGKGGDRIDESNTTVSELYYLVGQLQDQIAEQQRKIEELEAR